MPMTAIRVLIADDEALIRHALRVFIDAAPDIEVVGEASDGADAVSAARRLEPDVVVMDMQMSGMNGVEATAAIVAERPATRVLAITTFASDRFLLPVLRVGASAYLVKDTEPEELVSAIREVHDGSCVISPQVTRDLVDSVRTGAAPAGPDPLTDAESLTERELEVITLLGQGKSNAEIAGVMHVSEATVKTHLGHVMTKWGVRDRVQTLIRAVRADLIRLS